MAGIPRAGRPLYLPVAGGVSTGMEVVRGTAQARNVLPAAGGDKSRGDSFRWEPVSCVGRAA
jgi:hypothetical protein